MKRFEAAMLLKRLGHQFLPAAGDLAELALPLIDRLLEELHHLGAERRRGGRCAAFGCVEPAQLRFLVIMLVHTHPPLTSYCKFTGMMTYWKLGPPLRRPGRLAAESSKEMSSLSTTLRASTRNAGLKPISKSAPSYLQGKVTVASPVPGDWLEMTRPFLEN